MPVMRIAPEFWKHIWTYLCISCIFEERIITSLGFWISLILTCAPMNNRFAQSGDIQVQVAPRMWVALPGDGILENVYFELVHRVGLEFSCYLLPELLSWFHISH